LKAGLPANTEAEQFVLGSILLDNAVFAQAAVMLWAGDFHLQKHKSIYQRMLELYEQGVNIEYLTLANALKGAGQLESVDGVAYLSSLTEGMPRLESIEEYCRIVKDNSLLRQMIFAGQSIIGDCANAGGDPVKEVLSRCEQRVLGVGDSQIKGGLMTARKIMESHDHGVHGFLAPGHKKGLLTGFAEFDEMTTGLHPVDLFIIAARPSMGKTALALNIAYNVAASGSPVAIFSLEMDKDSLLGRLVCSEARVNHHKFRSGHTVQEERQKLMGAAEKLSKIPLYIDDNSSAGQVEMHAKLRRMKQEAGLGLVIVDYLQLMGEKAENRNQELSKLSRGFKLMAKDLSVPVILLSQLSRAPETRGATDKRPQLSDLRDSGAIEQDANLVAFIFREEVYKPDREDLKGCAELVVRKQRNGPIGTVDLVFLDNYVRFENRAPGWQETSQSADFSQSALES